MQVEGVGVFSFVPEQRQELAAALATGQPLQHAAVRGVHSVRLVVLAPRTRRVQRDASERVDTDAARRHAEQRGREPMGTYEPVPAGLRTAI